MQICEEENYPQNFQLNSAKYANIANYRHIIQNNILHFHQFYKTPDTKNMAAQETLDETDLKILQLLQQDSSLTVKELAAKVNLSASPIRTPKAFGKRRIHYALFGNSRPAQTGQRHCCAMQHKTEATQHARFDQAVHGNRKEDRTNNRMLQHHRRL